MEYESSDIGVYIFQKSQRQIYSRHDYKYSKGSWEWKTEPGT